MNAIEQLRRTGEFTELYIEHLTQKVLTNKRRKADFSHEGYRGKRTHWSNHAGTFRFEDERKGPKFWHGQRPVLAPTHIGSYRDLAAAIQAIASGDKNYCQYDGTAGINRERLRVAQSWRDRGISYDVSDVVRLSLEQMRDELGFGMPRNGGKYHH